MDYITVSFSICCFIFLSVMAFTYFLKKRIKNKENKIYSLLIVENLIMLIIDIFGFVISKLSISEVLNLFISKTYLIFYFLYTVLFGFYSMLVILENKKEKKIVQTFYSIVMGMFFVIILFADLKLNHSTSLPRPEGLAFDMCFVSGGFFFTFLFLLFIFNFKHINHKKNVPIYILFIFGLSADMVQYYNPYISLLLTVITLSTFIMYFTIENPDVKMIAELDKAKMAAEKANRAKSDFLSSMSHEIRTPLNAIVGFSDCILDEETLDAAKGDAKDIKLASENLLEIVNGILDISKIEANKMEIVETDYNVTEIMENVAKLVKPRIQEKPIELIYQFAPDLPYMLHGDGGKLRQIVTNILTNAAKYTEEGRITFLVNCVNEGDTSSLVISVEDTGRGIKPEQIDKLFAKFQRLDEDKNTTLEGTGLGLAITKKFVEMMGGKIVVQSKYGDGSKFTVYVKQKIVTKEKPANEEVIQNNPQSQKITFGSKKILVVDDNKINLRVATKLLSNFGITAYSLESGFLCLEKITNGEKYDLILLDDMMPKMSGVETLQKLKEIDGFNTPVVALTANAISGMREQYLSVGFNDYLSKPIDRNELTRVLNEYLK